VRVFEAFVKQRAVDDVPAFPVRNVARKRPAHVAGVLGSGVFTKQRTGANVTVARSRRVGQAKGLHVGRAAPAFRLEAAVLVREIGSEAERPALVLAHTAVLLGDPARSHGTAKDRRLVLLVVFGTYRGSDLQAVDRKGNFLDWSTYFSWPLTVRHL
jgi:hypothetical protein